MLQEILIVTAGTCQTGTCPKQPATAPASVVVIEAPKTPAVTFLNVERPNYRPLLPNLFQRKATAPVVVICPGGKCR